MVRRYLSIFAIFAAITLPQAVAQNQPEAPPPFDVRAHYTKYEYAIPMRDGKKLFTAIYVPKDITHSYPFLTAVRLSDKVAAASRSYARS